MNKGEAERYIRNGGAVYNILGMGTLRDGGNMFIECDNGLEFYVSKENKLFYRAKPFSVKNQVTDELELKWLAARIDKYMEGILRQYYNIADFFVKQDSID